MKYIEIIKKMPYIHCARGSKTCAKCKELEKKNKDFALIKVYLKGTEISRPMMEIIVGSQRIFGEYDILKRFKNQSEAKEYTIKNKIEIDYS